MIETLKVVGTPIPRVDGVERATGRAVYTGDVKLPGMLHARVLRSPHPHAKIRRIDTSRALALPGVKAIITHENCEVSYGAGDSAHTRYLFNNPVRFVGDPVAAVAAVNAHLAEEALDQIVVEYEPLEFVLDAEDALSEGAIEIYPGGNLSPSGEGGESSEGKTPPVGEPEVYTRGDVEAGFASSDRVFEDVYTSQQINNAQMEPRVTVAQWHGDELTVWATSQSINGCQASMASDLKLPKEKVRVISKFSGGGFGSKATNQDHDLMAAVLARETARPVKLQYSRREDYIGMHGKWPTRQYYKVGMKEDGTVQAIQLRGYQRCGPYKKAGARIEGIEVYRCPNVRKELYAVFTNTSVTGNYRGPATPQGYFGIESMMDDIAYQMGVDPVEFRLKNMTLKYNDEVPYTSLGLEQCLREGAERFEWKRRWHPPGADPGPIKKGVGVAMALYYARVGRSGAVLRLDSEGRRLFVHAGVIDVGTGAKTAMAMIAAEAMEMPLEHVHMVYGDTDETPYGIGESGSRSTVFVGDAIIAAAKQMKSQIQEKGLPKPGEVFVASANTEPKLKGMVRYSAMANFAEVEVDMELGTVRVTKCLMAMDAGRIISPLTAMSQTTGGVIMGLGMALTEELLHDPATGVQLTPGYYGAKVLTHMEAPEIEVHFIEPEDAYGPYGAKAIGEAVTAPVIGMVGNAVFNATGKRIKELPITRARILGA